MLTNINLDLDAEGLADIYDYWFGRRTIANNLRRTARLSLKQRALGPDLANGLLKVQNLETRYSLCNTMVRKFRRLRGILTDSGKPTILAELDLESLTARKRGEPYA